jgi:hypothetical protein
MIAGPLWLPFCDLCRGLYHAFGSLSCIPQRALWDIKAKSLRMHGSVYKPTFDLGRIEEGEGPGDLRMLYTGLLTGTMNGRSG